MQIVFKTNSPLGKPRSLFSLFPFIIQQQSKRKRNKIHNVCIVHAQEMTDELQVMADGNKPAVQPEGVKAPLFDYQSRAVNWMFLRETGDREPYGGILADYMGLGVQFP